MARRQTKPEIHDARTAVELPADDRPAQVGAYRGRGIDGEPAPPESTGFGFGLPIYTCQEALGSARSELACSECRVTVPPAWIDAAMDWPTLRIEDRRGRRRLRARQGWTASI
jgi:hypothetical protein